MTKRQHVMRAGTRIAAVAIGSVLGALGCGSTNGGSTTRLSDADIAAFVNGHNAVRSDVTAPTNYTGTWAPLPSVTWSDSVAATAQAWANDLATTQNCALQHASNIDYGENLAMGTELSPGDAVAMWAGEQDKYTWSANYSMADFNGGSGHYTQLVWRQTSEIGCGIGVCASGRSIVCCRYAPPGNVIGRPVF